MASEALINRYVQAGGDASEDLKDEDELDLLIKTQKLERGKNTTSVVTGQLAGALDNAELAAAEYSAGRDTSAGLVPSLDELDPVRAGALSDEDLDKWLSERPNSAAAQYEKRMRLLTDNMPFLASLSNPETAPYMIGRLKGQAAASALGSADPVTAGPALYGLVGQLPELIPGVDIGADEALQFAGERQSKINEALNVGQPRNTTESAASIAGMLIPVPGPKKLEGAAAIFEAVTPFVVGATVPKMALNAGVAFGFEQGIRELNDSEDTEYSTVFDKIGVPDKTATDQLKLAPVIKGGMELGLPLIASLPVVAPLTAHIWTTIKPSTPKIVPIQQIDPSGPENLSTLETTGDQYMVQIMDDKQALINIGKRAGVPDPDALAANIDLNTQMSGLMKVNEGINSGKMRGQYGDFVAPIAPRVLYDSFFALPPEVQKEYDLYLKLGDYADDLRLQIADPKGPKGAAASLANAQAQRAALRAKYPNIAAFSGQYQGVMEATRDFLQQGPYALIGRNQAQKLAMNRKHFVPNSTTGISPNDPLNTRIRLAARTRPVTDEQAWLGRANHNKTLGLNDRRHSMDVMVEYTRGLLQQQLNNNVRGSLVDQLLISSAQIGQIDKGLSPLIRKASGEEVRKYPERIVRTVRQGKTTNYITSQLTAQIARFDPYFVHGVMGSVLVNSRRWFEHGTTGVASITFAPTTWIRDTFAGIANTAAGEKGPGGISVVTAPLSILSARATEAFVHAAEARLLAGKPAIPFMDPAASQQFVQRAANSMQNSVYTLAKEHGGYDASIMRTRVETATGMFREIAREIDGKMPWMKTGWGYSGGALLKGWGAVFDAMQEAPRYSAFVRNLKAGKRPEEAVRIARRITGDTNRSGRVFDSNGRMMRADSTSPNTQLFDRQIGSTIELMREAVPYFNPSIQGMRRAFGAAAEDPVRFAMRSWMTTTAPALMSMAWNNWLTAHNPDGHDYNKYQFDQRSMRDQVMEPIYVGIPGLEPERGISIPLAHEQILFGGPYQQMIQHLYQSDEKTAFAVNQFGLAMLTNSVPLSPPPLMNAAFAATGNMPPQFGSNSYDITEDNVGFFNQNVEMTVRELAGNASAFALDAAYAFALDGPGAAGQEFSEDVLSKVPVLKGLVGYKRQVTYNTPLSAEQQAKLSAYDKFEEEFNKHFRYDGIMKSTDDLPQGPRGVTIDAPLAHAAPLPTPKPTNPIYGLFGDYIRDSMESNDFGMRNIRARRGALTESLNLLKGYNRGRQKDFEAYQTLLGTAKEGYETAKADLAKAEADYDAVPRGSKQGSPEQAAKEEAEFQVFKLEQMMKTKQIMDDNDIDLSERFDVERLINILENERYATMSSELEQIRKIEDDVTDKLVGAGLFSPGQQFRMEKDLAPMEVNPR